MKNCEKCEFYGGYDYDYDTEICTHEGGDANCPFNDISSLKNNGIKIEIDAGFMHEYIRSTLKNTIESETICVARNEIKNLVAEEMKQEILEEMRSQIKDVISKAISDFMKKEITIGGTWIEPERKMTREQYLGETIESELKFRFDEDAIKRYAENRVREGIDKYNDSLRDEINAGIKTYFNAATREILTENVVSMLMCNDTYKKLSENIQNFLPNKTE